MTVFGGIAMEMGGWSSTIYNLISLGILIFVSALATRESVKAGAFLTIIVYGLLMGIGWLQIDNAWTLFTLLIVLFVMAIIHSMKDDGG
jgi:hypothetical protein